jgi:hypothetical protein
MGTLFIIHVMDRNSFYSPIVVALLLVVVKGLSFPQQKLSFGCTADLTHLVHIATGKRK